MREIVLGIDIGGSHITVGLVNLTSGEILSASLQRCEVDSNDAAEVILNKWCEVIRGAYQHTDQLPKRIGIAMPGPFDYENGICLIKDQEKFTALYRVNVKEELAKRLHMEAADISFINDAAAFLQGEVFSGAARGSDEVIGFTLGTGLGSAYCVQGIAEDADLWQSPFKGGMAEDYLATRWFVKRYRELAQEEVAGVKELLLTADRQVKLQIFREFSEHLAAFLEPVILLRKADTVVLGGNIANAYPLFLPLLEQLLSNHGLQVAIKIAELQENASLIGAASSITIKHLND